MMSPRQESTHSKTEQLILPLLVTLPSTRSRATSVAYLPPPSSQSVLQLIEGVGITVRSLTAREIHISSLVAALR
jgi:hypothetical protein